MMWPIQNNIFKSYLVLIASFSTGRPPPRVIWYLENVVIDESYDQIYNGTTLISINTLKYPNIGRQHLNARFVCQASNTNLAPAESKVVILDVNCK